MYQVNESDKGAQCFVKAKQRGEPTFTLRAQDRSAPAAICKWITANISTCPADKLRQALEDAINMREWQQANVAAVKSAD